MHGFTCARKMKSQTENIMKQFNLDEYLANPSKKVVTREGRDVRIICTDRVSKKGYPLVALVRDDGHELVHTYNMYGQFYTGDTNHYLDLFFATERKEGWINIYPDSSIGGIYTSEEEARNAASPSCISTIKIEWEE